MQPAIQSFPIATGGTGVKVGTGVSVAGAGVKVGAKDSVDVKLGSGVALIGIDVNVDVSTCVTLKVAVGVGAGVKIFSISGEPSKAAIIVAPPPIIAITYSVFNLYNDFLIFEAGKVVAISSALNAFKSSSKF